MAVLHLHSPFALTKHHRLDPITSKSQLNSRIEQHITTVIISFQASVKHAADLANATQNASFAYLASYFVTSLAFVTRHSVQEFGLSTGIVWS